VRHGARSGAAHAPWRAVGPAVFYAGEVLPVVGDADIERLQTNLGRAPRRRVRLCAHADVDDSLHDMFIVLARDSYVRPHRHLDRAESLHVIDGRADAVLFDAHGTIVRVVALGAFSASGGRGDVDGFFYRLAEPVFHTLVVRSERFVFHEATTGPWSPEATEPAPWAPDEADPAATAFRAALEAKTDQFLSGRPPDARPHK